MLSNLEKELIKLIAGIGDIPKGGAFSIRRNGDGSLRSSSANITVEGREDKRGINVKIKPGTKDETLYIPVLITKEGHNELVYNYFEIGEDSDVTIIAGCGIYNPGTEKTQHDGIHEFHLQKNSKLKYVEKHFAQGPAEGKKIFNPKTIMTAEEGGTAELELVQIKGVDKTKRDTQVILKDGAKVINVERMLTDYDQEAESVIDVEMRGKGSTCQIISRSVARGNSRQYFDLNMSGYNECRGHIQCDSIIMDSAQVVAVPKVSAFHVDAQLIHEAAIGKIASDQLIKLKSLGLTEEEAEAKILAGFLK